MGICLDGLRAMPICLGDPFARLSGETIGATEAGLGITGIVVVAALALMFRPA